MKIYFFVIISLFIIVSCDISEYSRKDKKPVVRIFDNYLFQSDLSRIVPAGLSPEDSQAVANDYIDKWIKKRLILKKADMNLTDEEKDIEQQIDDYRASLLIYKYQQKLLDQKLDTNVNNKDIEDYYNIHSEEFSLKENIVKLAYIKVPRNAPDHWRVKYWYKSNNEDDISKLEDYCFQYANKFYFKDDWIFFNKILQKLPVRIDNQEQYLRYNKYLESYDSLYYYFVDFKEYKLSNDTTPIDLVKEDIRNILLNKRKIQFIKDMENEIYRDALNKQKIEFFNKE